MSDGAVLGAILAIALLGALVPGAASPQDRPPPPVPSAPGSAGPVWQRTLRLSDGRTFVTDGAMAIDAALAKPSALPADVLPEASAGFVERHMSAPSRRTSSGCPSSRRAPRPGHTGRPAGST